MTKRWRAGAGESPAARLRAKLATKQILTMPCCFDALSAKLVERAGFDITFMSGFSTSAAKLALPDTGCAPSPHFTVCLAEKESVVETPPHLPHFVEETSPVSPNPWDQFMLSSEYKPVNVEANACQFYLQTLIICKLGFNQNYYTFTLILPIKIVLSSEFP